AFGSFLSAEVRHETGKPRLHGGHDLLRAEGVGQFLQTVRPLASQEGIVVLAKGDALAKQLLRQPLVTVEADLDVEGEVRADADEQPTQLGIAQVEVIEVDIAPGRPDVVIVRREADRDASAFAALEDDGDAAVSPELPVIWLDPIVAADVAG